MGFVHIFGDARMPIWGGLAILSNFCWHSAPSSGHRGFHFASLSYADPVRRYLQSFVKANQSASKRQKREEGSTMLESCRRRGIDQ